VCSLKNDLCSTINTPDGWREGFGTPARNEMMDSSKLLE